MPSVATTQLPILVCIRRVVLHLSCLRTLELLSNTKILPHFKLWDTDFHYWLVFFLYESLLINESGQSPQLGICPVNTSWCSSGFLLKQSDSTFWIAIKYIKRKQILHCIDLPIHFPYALGNLISLRLLNCWLCIQEGSRISWVL